MAVVSSPPVFQSIISESLDVDKLTYEIFSILENKFLFGYDFDTTSKLHKSITASPLDQFHAGKPGKGSAGKVRILSIDGRGTTDGILAAKSLAHLESCLRLKSGNQNARISDYFDVVAGSGAGGILAALLFTRGKDGVPMFTADGALNFLRKNHGLIFQSPGKRLFRRISRTANARKLYEKTFSNCTLKDTLKAVLIPCYDLSTRAPFVFSRADASEMDGYDFKIKDVCAATSADPTAQESVEMWSLDRRTRIVAVDGSIPMNNPTAAAITHVLNNKLEFPYCKGVEDLIVMSLGNGECVMSNRSATASPANFTRIAADGAADMVDQAVSMAFVQSRTSNYVRIQGNEIVAPTRDGREKGKTTGKKRDVFGIAENMLSQKSVESVLFKGKTMAEASNAAKVEKFSDGLIKEEERRKTSTVPVVVLRQAYHPSTPRTSSSTSLSTFSS